MKSALDRACRYSRAGNMPDLTRRPGHLHDGCARSASLT